MADVSVKDVMTHLVVTLYPTDTVHEAATKFARNHISGAPVVEEGKVVGVVSESDLIHSLMPPDRADRGSSILDVLSVLGRARPHGALHGKTVDEVMSPLVIQVSPETSIWKAASIMERRGVKRLPVVDEEGYLIGIVSRADLVKALAKDDAQTAADVTEAIDILGRETFSNLEVEVDDGVATIRGMADRKSTKELAVKLASRTPGVVEVVDRITFEIDDSRVRIPNTPDPRFNWQPESAGAGWDGP